jgi:hypothetical protein
MTAVMHMHMRVQSMVSHVILQVKACDLCSSRTIVRMSDVQSTELEPLSVSGRQLMALLMS